MLFNSREFLIFFPVVAGFFFLLPPSRRWVLLLAASYFFYMWARVEYGLIMLLVTLSSYAGTRAMSSTSDPKLRKLFLLADVGFCLFVLGYYKYAGFLFSSANDLLSVLSVDGRLPQISTALPIGISFYTFMSISYSVDVYRGHQKAERHFGIHALYLSFFPHLVAGPIMRSEELRPQFRQLQTFDSDRAVDGLRLVLWGLFKKMVVADSLAPAVTEIYGNPSAYTGLPLLIATLFFAIQIYCDFSGYCDIAIGCARLMGFTLPVNFDRPYGSRSVGEFWRRWHITLGTWFRDYVYIPLGGNRGGTGSKWSNLLIVFLLSGLWHGASWTFIIWGGIHGLCIIIERLTAAPRHVLIEAAGLRGMPWLTEGIGRIWTLSCVILAWIFFRAQSLPDAVYIVSNLFSGLGEQILDSGAWAAAAAAMGVTHLGLAVLLATCIGVIVCHWREPLGHQPSVLDMRSRALRHLAYYALVLLILFAGNTQEVQFIYFQF